MEYKDNVKEEEEKLPAFIEDDHQYDGKSYFANIDAFSAQACQPFPKVRTKIRHAPENDSRKEK